MTLNQYIFLLFVLQIIIFIIFSVNIVRLNHEIDLVVSTMRTCFKKLETVDLNTIESTVNLSKEVARIDELQSITSAGLFIEGIAFIGLVVILIFLGGRGTGNGTGGTACGNCGSFGRGSYRSIRADDFFLFCILVLLLIILANFLSNSYFDTFYFYYLKNNI